jgi:hypothetical protein
MKPVVGWWEFDPDLNVLRQTVSGQTIRFSGLVTFDAEFSLPRSNNLRWMRFDYRDGEVSYPLLVEWRNIPEFPEGPVTSRRNVNWRVDHLRSAALWRREAGFGPAYPQYGLWRRVDSCVCDAFACWPVPVTGAALPGSIGLNGGWWNGHWTENLFREVRHADVTSASARLHAVLQTPWIERLDRPPPSPWEFVPQTGSQASGNVLDWGFVLKPNGTPTLAEGTTPTGVERSRPYLRDAKQERFLIPFYRTKVFGFVRFVYVDPEIVTDLLAINVPKSEFDSRLPSMRIDLVHKRIGVIRRKDGQPITPVLGPSQGPGRDAIRVPSLQQELAARLMEACVDGWLEWPGADVALQDEEGGSPVSLRLERPSRLGIAHPDLAGSDLHVAVRAARSAERVIPPLRPGAHPWQVRQDSIAYLFQKAEGNDGILRVAEPTTTTGWWQYDPERGALVNGKSGQRISYVDRLPDRDGHIDHDRSSLRFVYEDSDIRHTIRVDREGTNILTWRFDHNKSAEDDAPSPDGVPPYGLWRRLEDCLHDAFLAWPETEVVGQRPRQVESRGGWRNATWMPNVGARSDAAWSSEDPPASEPVDPVLEPLDASSPMWRFVDSPSIERTAGLSFVEKVSHNRYILPSDRPLTGFENRVPYVIRSDGGAVIFPSRNLPVKVRDDWAHCLILTYADERVIVEYMAGEYHDWEIRLDLPVGFGLRDPSRRDELLGRNLPHDSFGPDKTPTLDLHRRMNRAFIDGVAAWTGSRHRMPIDPEWYAREIVGRGSKAPYENFGIPLGIRRNISITGGFAGGLYMKTLAQHVALAERKPAATSAGDAPLPDRIAATLGGAARRLSAIAAPIPFGRRKRT